MIHRQIQGVLTAIISDDSTHRIESVLLVRGRMKRRASIPHESRQGGVHLVDHSFISIIVEASR